LSGYFTILISFTVLLFVQLSRIVPLIVSRTKLKWLAKTDFERREAEAPGSLDYGVTLPTLLLNFTLIIWYA
jgi:hypothetical protein